MAAGNVTELHTTTRAHSNPDVQVGDSIVCKPFVFTFACGQRAGLSHTREPDPSSSWLGFGDRLAELGLPVGRLCRTSMAAAVADPSQRLFLTDFPEKVQYAVSFKLTPQALLSLREAQSQGIPIRLKFGAGEGVSVLHL